MLEADTRAKLIDPMLNDCGWVDEKIKREVATPGRIIDESGKRSANKPVDYVLFHTEGFPLAVVEAKKEGDPATKGMGQAKKYAERLGVLFAYSTNGHQIEEFDFITNKQTTLEKYPSPEELWARYFKGVHEKEEIQVSELLDQPLYLRGKRPRYYQLAAINKVQEAILNNKKRILLTMATGTGKTFVAFQLVWKLLKSGHFKRVLFIADRVFLRDQAYNTFGPFEDARDTIEEKRTRKTRDIYFSIYQSLYSEKNGKRVFHEYPRDFFDLIIIDECHRSGYGTWKEILEHFGGAVQLGLTATPKVSDNVDTYGYFGEPVYIYSMGQGIEDGYLAPYQIHRFLTNVDKNGLDIKTAIEQGAELIVKGDLDDVRDFYTLENYERDITIPERTEIICNHLADKLKTLGSKEKTIVFCVNMEHASQVAKALQNSFSYEGLANYAIRIVSEEYEVKELFEEFSDSEKKSPVIATTVDLLTTGVDMPSVKNIVFIKPLSSKVYFKQHMGRGCRIDDISQKYMFRIIDYVNATRLIDGWDVPEPGDIEEPNPPYDLTVKGMVLNGITNEPIINARIVAQLGPNKQKATRTDRIGVFIFEQLPHSSITLQITKNKFRSKGTTINPESTKNIIIELLPEEEKTEILIKGIEIHIAEETEIKIFDGRLLSEAKYKEYSKDGVIEKAATLKDLLNIWLNKIRRDKFLEELRNKSIDPDVLGKIMDMTNADGFDILASIAFDVPIITKDERVRAFINKKSDTLNALGPKGKEVILTLLDKYRIGGIDEFGAEAFRVKPFDKMGFIQGIANIFGGMENLRNAIDQATRGLYEQ